LSAAGASSVPSAIAPAGAATPVRNASRSARKCEIDAGASNSQSISVVTCAAGSVTRPAVAPSPSSVVSST
jgi:hypothetical protein